MAVCYFNRDYSKKYRCQFEKKDNGILVKIEYDISNEIESIDGVKIFGINTEIDSRDILIIDYEKKANYLLKDAYFLVDIIFMEHQMEMKLVVFFHLCICQQIIILILMIFQKFKKYQK